MRAVDFVLEHRAVFLAGAVAAWTFCVGFAVALGMDAAVADSIEIGDER